MVVQAILDGLVTVSFWNTYDYHSLNTTEAGDKYCRLWAAVEVN